MQTAPLSITDAVSKELIGQRLLWAASPNRWAYAQRYLSTALFGIPFTAFAFFWEYQVFHIPTKGGAGPATFFPLWGMIFVVVGVGMLLSPLWAYWSARNVYYVVTDRCAVIFEKGLKLTIKSFPRSAVVGYERTSSGGAAGNIIFQRITTGTGRGSRVKEIGFIGLTDYSAAEQALTKLIDNNVA